MPQTSSLLPTPPLERRIFTNRTLNMRNIRAIGYDMDYTLIHYDVRHWELTAYENLRQNLQSLGWPVEDIRYDPEMMIRGLVIDKKLGNIVKPNRFGYVKRAFHGTVLFDFNSQRQVYARTVVDIREDRWALLTTLFDLPLACMYAQLVDKYDRRELPQVQGYADLLEQLSANLDTAYDQGLLKQEILKDVKRYVVEDENTPLALLDQRQAGKKLILITDSDWGYAKSIMSHIFDPHLPLSMTWRDLFDLVIVSAGKPNFFLREQPAFEVVTEDGLLQPVVVSLQTGRSYVGGHARLVEEALGLDGSEILYVGDHIESDVHASKSVRRWRTALVLRELEAELACVNNFWEEQAELSRLMKLKTDLENEKAQIKLQIMRNRCGYGRVSDLSPDEIKHRKEEIIKELKELDEQIGPLAQAAQILYNPHWGLLTRSGYDKSYLTRLLEGHADIYMSRVSNFLYSTPFAYLRSTRSSLPHDGGVVAGPQHGDWTYY